MGGMVYTSLDTTKLSTAECYGLSLVELGKEHPEVVGLTADLAKSTKIGVFEDETLLFEETLRHTTEEISQFATIVDQKDFRKKIITDLLASKNFDMKSLNMVVGRGGMLKPIPGGTYAVTDDLLHDLD